MPQATKCRQPEQKNKVEEKPQRDPLEGTITKQVLKELGTPVNLQAVQITKVGEGRYRVNVRCSQSGSFEINITDSFFLRVDKDGVIEKSSPQIEKKYHC